MKKLIILLLVLLIINVAHAQVNALVVGSGADTMTNTTALILKTTGSIATQWVKGEGAFIFNTTLLGGSDTGYIIIQRSYDGTHWGSAAGDTTNLKENENGNIYKNKWYYPTSSCTGRSKRFHCWNSQRCGPRPSDGFWSKTGLLPSYLRQHQR